MDSGSKWERRSFLGRRLPRGYAIWAISVDPGCGRAYAEGEWRDAIVVVERGEIELEWRGGSRQLLGDGWATPDQ